MSRRLGTPSLNLHGTGLDNRGLPVAPDEVYRADVADRPPHAGAASRTSASARASIFALENLNTAVDHPRTPFARRPTPLDLVRGVD